MATGDKLVNLNHSRAMYQLLDGKIGDLKSALGEETEMAIITDVPDGSVLSNSGVYLKRGTGDNIDKVAVYGAAQNGASRNFLYLNGLWKTKTSSSAFEKTLEKGTYLIEADATGFQTNFRFRYTYTTFPTGTTFLVDQDNKSRVITFTNDVMIGFNSATGVESYGSEENPTYISFSAKRLIARDIIARNNNAETNQRLSETNEHIDQTDQDISDFKERTDHIVKSYDYCKDISDEFEFTDGKRIHYLSGVLNSNSPSMSAPTEFISVDGYDKLSLTVPFLEVNNEASVPVHGMAFYTEANEESFLSGIRCGYHEYDPDDYERIEENYPKSTFKYRMIAVPAGAKYFRTTWWASTRDQYDEVSFQCIGLVEKDKNVPSYYFENSYLDNKIDNINIIGIGLSRNALRTTFITDYHLEDNTRKSPSLISYIIDKTGIRNVIFGGDAYNSSYGNKAGAVAKICQFMSDFTEVREKGNLYLITGNHEMNNADNQHDTSELSKNTVFNLFNAPLQSKIHNLWVSGVNTVNAFYFDDDTAKLRVYCIDCRAASSLQPNDVKTIIGSFATVPDGYSMILFSHLGMGSYTTDATVDPPVYTTTALYPKFEAIMMAGKAMDDGINASGDNAIKDIEDGVVKNSWNVDYSGRTRTFVGAFVGHTHKDTYYIYENKYPVIFTACDQGAYDLSWRKYRKPYTINEQAFDVVQVDLDTKRIYCTRIGFGSDRVFAFGENAGLITE